MPTKVINGKNILSVSKKGTISYRKTKLKNTKNKYKLPRNIEQYVYSDFFNHVYLYDDISNSSVKRVREEIAKLNKTVNNNNNVKKKPKSIILHLNSPGGCLDAGLALTRIINKSRTPIIVLVEGISASAATFVTVLSNYKIMAPYSTMLIHQYNWGYGGQHEDLEFYGAQGKETMDIMYRMYSENTKIPHDTLVKLMKHDLYLDAKTSLKYGLVDKILDIKKNDKLMQNYFIKNPEYKLEKSIINKKTNFNDIYVYPTEESANNIYNSPFEIISKIQKILINGNNMSASNNVSASTNIINKGGSKPIILHINDAYGWNYLTEVIPILNTICLSTVPIYGMVDSTTNGLSLVYLLPCFKIMMYKYTYITLDFLKNMDDCSYKFEDTIHNTLEMRKTITNVFKKYSKLPKNILDNLFKERFIIKPDEAKRYGLCDYILD
jgi:ATP-dependent Clp protease protease subunit